AVAIGAVLAGVLSGGLVHLRRQGAVIVAAILGFAASVTGFGVLLLVVGEHRPQSTIVWALVVAVALLALAGAADSISSIFRQTVLQAATPDSMRGRLQGVFIVVVAGGPRLGDLVVGSLASRFGEGAAAVIGGVTCAAVVLLLSATLGRRLLRYDAADPQPCAVSPHLGTDRSFTALCNRPQFHRTLQQAAVSPQFLPPPTRATPSPWRRSSPGNASWWSRWATSVARSSPRSRRRGAHGRRTGGSSARAGGTSARWAPPTYWTPPRRHSGRVGVAPVPRRPPLSAWPAIGTTCGETRPCCKVR